MTQRIARWLLALFLCSSLSACQMTVRLVTHLNTSGGGSFTLTMTADKELRDQLIATAGARSGLASVEGLFDGLRTRGWTVTRTDPSGGLSFTATRTFGTVAEFDAMLGDIRMARGGPSGEFGGIKLNFGYETKKGFLRTRSMFHGAFDTSGLKLDKDIVRAVQGLVRFEIRTQLPGGTTVGDANGSVSNDNVAVWRPDLGSAVTFSATSSALRVGSLLFILIPGLVLLAAIAWFAIGRHTPRPELGAIEPSAEPAHAPAVEPVPLVEMRPAQPVFLSIHPEPIDRTITLDGVTINLDAPPIDLETRPVSLDIQPITLDVEPLSIEREVEEPRT